MPRYNHAFDFTFEVETDHAADDVTGAELRAALLERVARLSDAEMLEACGCFDTMEDDTC